MNMDKIKESIKKINSKIDYKTILIVIELLAICFLVQEIRIHKLKNYIHREYKQPRFSNNNLKDYGKEIFKDETKSKNKTEKKSNKEKYVKDNFENEIKDFYYKKKQAELRRQKEFEDYFFNDPFFDTNFDFEEELINDFNRIERERQLFEDRFNRFNERRKIFEDKLNRRKKFFDRINNKNKREDYSFFVSENFDKKDNQYILNISVPNYIEDEDVKIDLKDNMFSVNINKNNETKEKDFESKDYFNYSKSFIIPDKDLSLNDIKKELKNNRLTITIPFTDKLEESDNDNLETDNTNLETNNNELETIKKNDDNNIKNRNRKKHKRR